jgi:hypothetical protein
VDWVSGEGENDYEDYEAAPAESCILNVAGNSKSNPSTLGHAGSIPAPSTISLGIV